MQAIISTCGFSLGIVTGVRETKSGVRETRVQGTKGPGVQESKGGVTGYRGFERVTGGRGC